MNDYADTLSNEISNAPIYEFFVAGVQHHKLKTCINEINVGDKLSLIIEPTNKYDPNAVRIEYESLERNESIMIGYVPAKLSPSVSALFITSILECEVLELNKDNKPWQQIKVGIREV